MSKLDKYIEQKRIYDTVKDNLFHATRRDALGTQGQSIKKFWKEAVSDANVP